MTSAAALYRTLRALATQQTEALAAGDLDAFLRLLDERDALLSTMAAHPPPPDDTGRGEAAALLKAVLELDESNAAKLREALDAARQDLSTLRDGRRVMQSYRAIVEQEARFIDRGG